jgi:hypothetical protein
MRSSIAVLQIGHRASGGIGWPENPQRLAGRLRRAQTFLRTMGIDVDFVVKAELGIG